METSRRIVGVLVETRGQSMAALMERDEARMMETIAMRMDCWMELAWGLLWVRIRSLEVSRQTVERGER